MPNDIEEIHFVACGSSFYAAQFCAQFFESHCKVPSKAYVASEFRDQPPLITRNTLIVALSQSGETADVLGALRERGPLYFKRVALCNRPGSMIESLVDFVWPIEAGPEYSVASTKAFTAQICQLSRFMRLPCSVKGSQETAMDIQKILQSSCWERWAAHFRTSASLVLLARGALIPIIHEGALKLRELTYKQTYAISSGELKHGSLALIDSSATVILCIPNDHTLHKNLIAAQEVHARSGNLWVLLQEGIDPAELPAGVQYEFIPSGSPLETALYFTLPMQMIALKLAKQLGNSIDRPRNLAKSVTVE